MANDTFQVGENITAKIENGKLVMEIDLSKTIGLSSTGKMMGIASTGGFAALPNGLKANIYIGKKA